jgi:thiol-disulfide isomerase/thioredoxin
MPCARWWQAVHKAARGVLFLAVAGIAATAGFYFNSADRPGSSTVAGAPYALLRTAFADLAGKPQRLDQWKGRVLVVNFWATWCAPCREEIPALMKVQKKHDAKSVQVVGIAFDNVDKVREYAAEMKIDYALLMGGMDTLGVMKEAGNRGGVLPYSLVLDRNGKLVHAHVGALTEAALDTLLAPLL